MNFGILDANSWKIERLPKESTGKVNACYARQVGFLLKPNVGTFWSQHFKTTSELGLRKAFLKAPNAEYFICNCSSASSCPTWESCGVFVPPGHKTTRGTSHNSWETSLGAGCRGNLDFSSKLILLWKWNPDKFLLFLYHTEQLLWDAALSTQTTKTNSNTENWDEHKQPSKRILSLYLHLTCLHRTSFQ